jgi:hypothetical protein
MTRTILRAAIMAAMLTLLSGIAHAAEKKVTGWGAYKLGMAVKDVKDIGTFTKEVDGKIIGYKKKAEVAVPKALKSKTASIPVELWLGFYGGKLFAVELTYSGKDRSKTEELARLAEKVLALPYDKSIQISPGIFQDSSGANARVVHYWIDSDDLSFVMTWESPEAMDIYIEADGG